MHNAKFFLRFKLHHLFFWMLVFGLWYFLRYQDYPTEQIAFSVTLLKVIDLAAIIYFTNYVLIPRLLYKRKYTGFIISFLLIIIASGFLKIYAMGQIMHEPDPFGSFASLKIKLYENVISDFFLVAAGAAFKLIFDYTEMQQRLVEIA